MLILRCGCRGQKVEVPLAPHQVVGEHSDSLFVRLLSYDVRPDWFMSGESGPMRNGLYLNRFVKSQMAGRSPTLDKITKLHPLYMQYFRGSVFTGIYGKALLATSRSVSM